MKKDGLNEESSMENLLQETFEAYREPVDAAVWEGVMAGIAPKKKRRLVAWWWWGAAASVAVLLLLGTWWWGAQHSELNGDSIADKNIPSTQTENASTGNENLKDHATEPGGTDIAAIDTIGSNSGNSNDAFSNSDNQTPSNEGQLAGTSAETTKVRAEVYHTLKSGSSDNQNQITSESGNSTAMALTENTGDGNNGQGVKAGMTPSDGTTVTASMAQKTGNTGGGNASSDPMNGAVSKDENSNALAIHKPSEPIPSARQPLGAGPAEDTLLSKKRDNEPYWVQAERKANPKNRLTVPPMDLLAVKLEEPGNQVPDQLEAPLLLVSPFSPKSKRSMRGLTENWMLAANLGALQPQSTSSTAMTAQADPLGSGETITETDYLQEFGNVPVELADAVEPNPAPELEYSGSVTAAFTVQYRLLPRFTIETGFQHSSYQFTSEVSYRNELGELGELITRFSDRYIGLPVIFNYHVLQGRRFTGHVGLGAAAELGYTRKIKNTTSPSDSRVETNSSSKLNDLNLVLPVGVGVGYRFSRNFSFYLQPGVNVFIPGLEPEGVSEIQVSLLQPNLRTGLRLHL